MFDIAGQAYRLIGSLPVLAVMVVGLWLVILHRDRNPRVCTLMGIALVTALATYIVLPVAMQFVIQALVNQFEPGSTQWQLVLMFQTFVFASASALVWSLTLFAIFGRGGVVDARREPDEDFE